MSHWYLRALKILTRPQHMNNAVYYHLYDSIINDYLARCCGVNPGNAGPSDLIGLVVSSYSNFYRPLSFPQTLELGLRVVKLGNSSVTYEVGVFEGDIEASEVQTAAAVGGYTHVFVENGSRKSVRMDGNIRRGLEKLLSSPRSML